MSLEQEIAKVASQIAGVEGAIRTLIEQFRGTYGAPGVPAGTEPLAQPPSTPAPSNADALNPNAITATTEKKGPGRSRKAAEAPAPVATPEPVLEVVEPTEAANDDDFLNDEPTAPVVKLTKDDVRAKLVSLQKAKGSPEASRALLKKYKADTLGTLKETDYAKIIADVNAQLPKAA